MILKTKKCHSSSSSEDVECRKMSTHPLECQKNKKTPGSFYRHVSRCNCVGRLPVVVKVLLTRERYPITGIIVYEGCSCGYAGTWSQRNCERRKRVRAVTVSSWISQIAQSLCRTVVLSLCLFTWQCDFLDTVEYVETHNLEIIIKFTKPTSFSNWKVHCKEHSSHNA